MRQNTVCKVEVKEIVCRLGLIALMTAIWLTHLYLMIF